MRNLRKAGPPPSGVVVITGASSGIGRVTAHAFARQGARLVLAARSASSLDEAVAECRRLGAEALAVPTDVTDEEQVQALVRAAIAEFGGIDVWVGNASVFGYGAFEHTPAEVFRQIIETNLMGQTYGVRAVLPHFRARGAGTLVLVGSVYSKVSSPYVSAYIASKHALLGFAEAVRQELADAKEINLCLVLPATADTPIYQHAANHTGRRVHPLPPVVSPVRVARTIVRLVERPQRVAVVGKVQGSLIPVHAHMAGLYDRFIVPTMNALALRKGRVEPHDGTLFAPDPPSNAVTGGWRRRHR
ncbi:short-chain dehydrogenase [Zafaria cholistanensis]|uniref:Short-chain dehydrogenase n=1 Tax=Zafaria cholistanensis TaxID=1682741 RepID=A0A5A7NQX5_9MICC|nr:SDR family oxidoreductase [Zafaria cholistanensis]GER23200.1 short-chain dehydrogenase [Zafaria cholistanensis]